MSLTQSGSLGGSGSGTPVVLTDNTNGTLTVDNGSTPQNTIRPIPELSILTRQNIDPAADYEVIYDASTGNHVRSLATRASQTAYLADGQGDTRAGSLGNINTSIFAAWDHIHPILAITAPATPTITLLSGAMTITPILISTTITEEESVTFQFRVQCNIPIHTNTWQAIAIPSIAGFKSPIVNVNGTYRQSGTPTRFPTAPYMGNEASLWGGNTVYVGGYTENAATIRYVHLNIKYVIL